MELAKAQAKDHHHLYDLHEVADLENDNEDEDEIYNDKKDLVSNSTEDDLYY